MPDAGYLPIPQKLARAGVNDMVRISDARMSGTAHGTIVLHVSPDAASGGPLGLVQSGDRIGLSVRNRTIDLLIDEAELASRQNTKNSTKMNPKRGYAHLYGREFLQADQGCDFDFLLSNPQRS
jgi:dihydroxy-acid dehydratase